MGFRSQHEVLQFDRCNPTCCISVSPYVSPYVSPCFTHQTLQRHAADSLRFGLRFAIGSRLEVYLITNSDDRFTTSVWMIPTGPTTGGGCHPLHPEGPSSQVTGEVGFLGAPSDSDGTRSQQQMQLAAAWCPDVPRKATETFGLQRDVNVFKHDFAGAHPHMYCTFMSYESYVYL